VKNKNNALSTAELWLEAIEREKLIPLSDPAFNKVRLFAKARKTMFRRRIFEWSPRNGQACMLPGCTATVPSLLHACGGCNNTEIKAIGTSGSNQAVQTTANAIRKGAYGRWTVLVNAGKKHAASGVEDHTIPSWMLPGTPGQRAQLKHDKPDIVIGESTANPPPTQPGLPTTGTRGSRRSSAPAS
jgi:hypothetical protein